MRAAGIPWSLYDDFMQKNVKHIGDERLQKVPADLDLKPYRDEHDTDLLNRMEGERASGHACTVPSGGDGSLEVDRRQDMVHGSQVPRQDLGVRADHRW